MEKHTNKLADISVAFAVEILNLVKFLKNQHETIICNQIGRAVSASPESASVKSTSTLQSA